MRKTLLLLLLTAVFCGAFARKTPQVAPAPQVPDSLRGFYLFTEGIKQAFIERDTAAARASLERSVEADSTYGPAWYELAELLLYNDAPAALRHAERAFRTDTTDKWYLLQLGQAQILNDRYRDAIRTYNRLREVDAQNPDSYRVLAMLYDQEGQPFSAMAYRIDSTRVAVLATYSEFYNERRDYASSLNYTRRLFASDEMPLDDKLAYFDRITGDRNFYSTFYLQINDLATTLAMKYPHDPRVVKLYGGHLIASGQLDDALTYYKTHLDDPPPRIDYFNMVIDIESYKQRPDSVERYTSRAMKLFPENVDLHLRKGQMLSYAKRYDEALKFYKNSLRLAPGDSLRGAVWGIIGETYHLMGQQALQKQSEDRQPKASLYESRKGPAARCMRKCYDAYDRSLALRYDNAMVLNNYAYFLSLEGRDLERALAMAGRAIVLEENNPTYLDTYAWVLYRLGRYDEAKKTMQQALSLDRSQSPDLQLHYGDILAALGEKFMAEVYWKKALEGGYDAPDAIVERFRRLKEAAQTPAAP